jgi:hypothetical protein
MRSAAIATSAALLLFSVGPAMPQSVEAPAIAQLRCSDIVNADPAYQAALVYYAAGYRDGSDYAMALSNTAGTQASSALSAMASDNVASVPAPSSASSSSASTPAGAARASASASATPILGGLTLQAQVVINGCKQSPNALLTDIIANRGGGTGFKGTPGGAPTATGGGAGGTTLPNPSGTTAASGATPGAASASGAAGVVSSVIEGASQQIQQGLSSTAPPSPAPSAAGTPAPAAGASSP